MSLCLAVNTVIAQQELIDTLTRQLIDSKSVQEKIDLHLGITRLQMLLGIHDSAVIHCKSALALARISKNIAQEANALTFKCMLDKELGLDHYSTGRLALEIANRSKSKDAIAFATYVNVEFAQYDAQKGIEILRPLLEENEQEISLKNRANIMKSLAWQYERTGDFLSAEKMYLTAQELFHKIRDSVIIEPSLGKESAQYVDRGRYNYNQCLVYLGSLYLNMGDYSAAIAKGEESLSYSQDMGASEIAYSANNLGDIHFTAGNLEKALNFYQQAEDFYQLISERLRSAQTLVRIANVFQQMKEPELAERNLLKGLGLVGDAPEERAIIARHLGQLYQTMKRKQDAFKWLLTADSLFLSTGDSLSRLSCQIELASIQAEEGLQELATSRIMGLIPQIRKINDLHLLFTAYYRLAQINDDNTDLTKAIEFANQALDVAQERKIDKSILTSVTYLLSDLMARSGDYAAAYKYHKAYHAYYDSIYTENAQLKLKEEQVKQNVDQHIQDKIQALASASDLDWRNKIYLAMLFVFIGLLGLTTFLLFKLRKNRLKLEFQNKQLNELNSTKDRFFGIIAHDIRSPIIALESVEEQMKYYASKNNLDKVLKISDLVSKTALQLNGLLDNLLNWALIQTGAIPYQPQSLDIRKITEETLEIFKQNAELKDIKLTNKIETNSICYADENAMYLVFRNLVSNAIKFSAKGTEVRLESRQQKEKLEITVIDSGMGLNGEEIEKIFELNKKREKGTAGERGSGLGLILCRDLLIQNQGRLRIKSKKGIGSRFIMDLPVGS
ncbi:MAG: tetratricopeptide repeat protein [Saprospiraceae bacterium]|nr:tetratricopeptide repeat protein [Saprospiraceae bacterium]